MRVRRLVHAAGLRYRVDAAPLPDLPRQRADMVFSRAHVAVFVDGCFWHGCEIHYRPSRKNAKFWSEKIAANMARDLKVSAALRENGWVVIRAWEHEEPGAVAERIIHAVRCVSRSS